MERTINDVLRTTTLDYLDGLDLNNPPDPTTIETELLDKIRFEFEVENACKPKNRHWRIPKVLDNFIIAEIILKINHVRRIKWAVDGTTYDLAIYQKSGEHEGIYSIEPEDIRNMICEYNASIGDKSIQEIIHRMLDKATPGRLSSDPDLVAVNNGIFNYATKKLLPFSPDYIFASKSAVNYKPVAVNPIIHDQTDGTDWDVETWISELSDDDGVPEFIWQVLGSIIRPNVGWKKSIFFYAEQGNNGKGTLCELMRNICGANSRASIPLADFNKQFALERIPKISAIITDENLVNDYTRATDLIKAIITSDTITIDRKFKPMIDVQFHGVMVQCVNTMPKFGDKTESMYRRLIFVPFHKCYTGVEKTHIKEEYLRRQDVLEYILCKVLNTDYYKFTEPQACLDTLAEFKVYNDTVRQFLDDVLDRFTWDLVPYQFVYDLYRSWHESNNPGGHINSKQGFIKQVKQILLQDTKWLAGDTAVTVYKKMGKPEPLMVEYNLVEWQNKLYKGNDVDLLSSPNNLAKSYRGLVRR
jgi:phage/plasmid primase, P4 family, C-terminal domain